MPKRETEVQRLRRVNAALLAACHCQLAFDRIEDRLGNKWLKVLEAHGYDRRTDAAIFVEDLTHKAITMASEAAPAATTKEV